MSDTPTVSSAGPISPDEAEDRALRVRHVALVVGGGTFVAVLGLAQTRVDDRVLVVVIAATSALVAGWRGDLGLRCAIVVLPFVGFIRRVTAGPSAYVFNDPLATLPLALLLVAITTIPRTAPRTPARRLLWLALWTAVAGALGVLQGADLLTSAYGTAGAVLPILAGVHVASGDHPGLARFALRALPVTAVLASAYALLQWQAPPSWDLAWLTTQQDQLVSVGRPVAGEFRLFGTTESPGTLALLVGLAVIVVAGSLLVPGPGRTAERVAGAVALTVMLLVLGLTAVRTSLFAIPIAVLVLLAVDRRIARHLVVPTMAVAVAAAIVLPSLLAVSDTGRARYDLSQLTEDQSFQDRTDLLPRFAEALAVAPLGQGPGTSGLASRLGADDPNAADVQNIDNGYLTRLIETGVPGLVLFLLAVASAVAGATRRLRTRESAAVDAPALGIVVFFLFADLAGPNTTGVTSIYLWIALGALAAGPVVTPRRSRREMVESVLKVARRARPPGRHRARSGGVTDRRHR